MTAHTPEQMRALSARLDRDVFATDARLAPLGVEVDSSIPHIRVMREARDSLRAAADQIEAVQRYVRNGEVEDDNGQHVVYTHGLASLLGLTADTTPRQYANGGPLTSGRRLWADTAPQETK